MTDHKYFFNLNIFSEHTYPYLHYLRGLPYKITFYKLCSYLSNCHRVSPIGVKFMTDPNIFSTPTFSQNIPTLYLHSLWGLPYKITFHKICSYRSKWPRVAPRGVKCMTNLQWFLNLIIFSKRSYRLAPLSKRLPFKMKLCKNCSYISTCPIVAPIEVKCMIDTNIFQPPHLLRTYLQFIFTP